MASDQLNPRVNLHTENAPCSPCDRSCKDPVSAEGKRIFFMVLFCSQREQAWFWAATSRPYLLCSAVSAGTALLPLLSPGAPPPSPQIRIPLFKQHHATHPGTFYPRGHPYNHQQPQPRVGHPSACPGQVHASRPKISPKYPGSPRLKRWAVSPRAGTPKQSVSMATPSPASSLVRSATRQLCLVLSVCLHPPHVCVRTTETPPPQTPPPLFLPLTA